MTNIIFADSMNQYVPGNYLVAGGLGSVWNCASTLVSIGTTGSRWGGKAMAVNSTSAFTQLWQNTSVGTLNFAYQSSNAANGPTIPIAAMMLSGVIQICLVPNANGGIECRRTSGSGTLIAASRNGVITTGNNYFFEWMFDIDPATGRTALYCEGELLFSLTGQNTRGAASNTCDQIYVQCPGSTNRYYSEMYASDTYVRVGERKFEPLNTNADTGVNQLTPNTGNAWDALNDSDPDLDTTYIASPTVGQRSMFGLTDLAAAPLAIETVIARMCARKDDAATRGVKIVLGDGSNSVLSTEKMLSAAYSHHSAKFDLAPDGGAWTTAKLAALLAGVEVTS